MRLRVRYRSEVAEFEVDDTGIGIAPTDLERIFEPFERGETTEARMPARHGLGLTIAKLLTEIMGGEITVTSPPGQGSRFRVRLLLAEVRDPTRFALGERQVIGYLGAAARCWWPTTIRCIAICCAIC